MKFKKIMLITLLLLAVLTVGAVSASDDGSAEDLAVDDVGGGDLADTPIKDADLLSNDDEGDSDDGDDDGSGEGDEIDYQVDAVTEFYINNESNVVFSLVCPDEATGKFVVDVTKDVENSNPEYINTFEHPILESEWGKQINFTVGELGITQNGFYNFELYHLQNDGDECNDDTYIDDFGADAFDSTEFRIVDTFDEADVNALAVNIPVFGLYCPDGHEGIVTVTVRLDRDEVALITNNTRQKNDDNLIYWYMPELNLTFVDNKYTINVKVNDDEFEEEWDVWFNNPVSFGEYSYVNMSDIFVNVEVPSEIEDGRIIIEVDGSVVFNKTLSEFPSTNDEFDYYYWHPPYHGPGEGDLRFKLYRIHNDVIEDAEAKEYNVTASLILDKREFIYNGSYTLRVPNIAENDGVSIQLINYTSFDMDDDWAEIAYISAPEGADGIVIVSSGDDRLFEENFYDLTDGGDFYLLRAGELDIREPGEYEITFAYWNGDELVVENTATFYFYENDYNDADDGVIIWVSDGDEKEFDLDSEDDLNTPFAFVSVQNDLNGRIVIMVWAGEEGDEQEFFAKDLEQITNKEDDPDNEGFTIYKISLNDLGNYNDLIECGGFKLAFINDEDDEIDSRSYNINHDEGIVTFWEDNENDADDGVIIYVPNGDDAGYDLGNEEDLNTPFAFVSVQNDLNGRIVIMVWNDEEGDEQEFFGIGLEDIVNKEDDPDNDGFTIYMISLNYLGNYNDLIDCGSFKLAFINDEDDEIDSRSYNIDNDEGRVMFWENDDEEEEEGIHGEGEEIEAEFTDANILNNDVVVTIPKENVPEDADNEFTVVILQEDEEPKEITFRLDKILEGDNYIIRVNDLQLPEFRENYGLFMFLQFYSGGEKAYYAEYWDDEFGIHIYESPCIFNETSILSDDDVITIQEIPEGIDEFTIIVSKQGSEDIVKTFKFSEIVEDIDDVWVSFKLADLGINETGDYIISVKYSDNLIYSGNLTVNKNVDIRTHEWDDEGDLETFESVDMLVANFRISESVTGYVKIYVNGTQVGENINLADLPVGSVPPDDGRQIILNDLDITESGEYTVKLELYSATDELLGDVEFDILVEVGESRVEIINGSYAYGTEATDEIIQYIIGAPLANNQYFNIYFNGELAGNITANGIEFNEEFTVPLFSVSLFKPGNYDVNVTFFDGETENDITTGTFSINELTLASDKEVYVYDKDSIIISFNMDSVADSDGLMAYYVYNWGPVGMDGDMVFPAWYSGDQLINDGLYNDGVVSFDVAWLTDEEGDVHFRLDMGTTLIYVTYENNTGIYGGFIEVNVVEGGDDAEYIFMTTGNVNPHFDINTETNVTGKVTIKTGGVAGECVRDWNLDEIAEYDDVDGRWHHDIYVDSSDLEEGNYTITVVYEDENGDMVEYKDFDIVIENGGNTGENPEIFIMWSDWPVFEKVEYSLDSTDMVHIYPNDDDSDLADIRITIMIGDEVYLNATLAELNLETNINDYNESYYTVGPAHFTKEIAPGHYDNVIAYYDSDNYHVTSTDRDMPDYVNLFGDSSIIFSNDIEYTYGDNGTTEITLVGATVSEDDISVDGHPEAQIDLAGNVITVSGLDTGSYTLKVITAPVNEYYRSVEGTANILVKSKPAEPVNPELSIDSVCDVEEGVNVTITIHALGNFTGSVKVLVGDVEVGSVAVSAGSGTFTIPAGNLTVGLNTVKITSEANENFTAGEANVAFNVTAKVIPPVVLDPNLTISVDDIREGTNAVIVITTNDTFSGIVKVQIGTGNYNVSVINGTGSYSVPGLAVGNYTATATFEATEAFNASTKNATFKVNKEVVPDVETSISTDSASASSKNPVYSIKLNPDATGTLRVKIGNNTYTKELKDGEANIEVTDLPAGTYEAVVSYSGDAKYAPISKTVNSTVKAETAIKATAVTTTYGTSKNIVITLTDANGNVIADKQVTVVLNGVSKTLTTNAKGQATYAIGTKLAVKKYDATVTFAGDDGYVKSTGTAKVTVNKAKSVLTAKKKTFKVKKAKKYLITLKSGKVAIKKVKVTLTGKFKGKKIKITVKTDKKGKATFNLKKLTKKGKFTATIKFAGNKYYKAVTKKAKITVK